ELVCGLCGPRTDQEHDSFLQQPGIDVVRALAAPRLLDHHRDQAERLRILRVALPVHACAPISSSNAMSLSVTLAFDRTHFTTFASRAAPSISDNRCGCM